jgi:hypothetical protein
MNVFNENDLEIVSEANTEMIRRLIQRLIRLWRRRQIRILIRMWRWIATCSDIDTELETNMERVAINDYFRGVDANTLSSLHDTLTDYVKKTKISKLRDKHNNMNMSLFAETIGGVRIEVISSLIIWTALFRNLGNCI